MKEHVWRSDEKASGATTTTTTTTTTPDPYDGRRISAAADNENECQVN